MSDIVLVAYSVKPIESADKDTSDILSDPYGFTFDSLSFVDITCKETAKWFYKDREPGGSKLPISLAASSWLLKRHPDGWHYNTSVESLGDAEVIFVGVGVERCLQLLGLECSLPVKALTADKEGSARARALPISMWKDPASIDILRFSGILEGVPADNMLKRRELFESFKDWKPHADIEQDLQLTAELAGQLGLFEQL